MVFICGSAAMASYNHSDRRSQQFPRASRSDGGSRLQPSTFFGMHMRWVLHSEHYGRCRENLVFEFGTMAESKHSERNICVGQSR